MTRVSLVLFMALFISTCTEDRKVKPGTYVELNTGDTIFVVADSTTGYAMNSHTRKPVYLYVDDNEDTIFTTGEKVNNKLLVINEGYEVDGAKVKVNDEEVKIRYEDYKKKVDGEEYKIKEGDYKEKVQGDGDLKIKSGDYKEKVETNGDVKIKTEDTKTKIKDGKTETKKRHKIF